MSEPHPDAARLQPLAQHRAEIEAQPVGEEDADPGFGVDAARQRARIGIPGGKQVLEAPRRAIEPRFVQRSHDVGDEIAPGAGSEARQRLDRRPVAAPPFGGIVRSQRSGRGGFGLAFRRAGEAAERLQRQRAGALAELRPHPAAAFPVFVVQRRDPVAGVGVGKPGGLFQRRAKPVFPLIVQARPAGRFDRMQQVLGPRRSQNGRNAVVERRRIAETPPSLVPLAAARGQRVRGGAETVRLRVERERARADVAKRRPAVRVAARFERRGVAHPGQQIADRIANRQTVEILRLEPAAAQRRDRLRRQQGQGAERGSAGRRVTRHVEPERVVGSEERLDGPVAAVALMPDGAAVLQLD